METNKKNTHGGKRSGAGRPRKLGTPTSVIRVPSYRKRNIQIEVDMFHSSVKEKPYNYSASEIYEVVSAERQRQSFVFPLIGNVI